MTFVDAVVEVHAAFDAAGVPHAFGGALALAYYAEPRATVDIDVNVFTPDDDDGRAVAALASIGYEAENAAGFGVPIAGVRFRHRANPFPLDLFAPLDPAYVEIADRVQEWPFGPHRDQLPFLSAEDLVVFKLSFGRPKDWVDLRQMCVSGPTLDLDYVERQLLTLRGPTMHPRLARLRALRGTA